MDHGEKDKDIAEQNQQKLAGLPGACHCSKPAELTSSQDGFSIVDNL
jgi:hypothetical protein